MKLTSEYLESVGFNITDNELGSLHFITAYKAVGELEIKVMFCKNNINLRIWHRKQNERPIINLLDCPTTQKFQLVMQLVDIQPSTCEIENPQNINKMNKLEKLPRSLVYKGKPYFLTIHVNFRSQIVIQYSYKPDDYILSYVVQPELEPYEPKSIESSNGSFNENIGNCRTLDDCIDRINGWIDKNELIEPHYYKEKK